MNKYLRPILSSVAIAFIFWLACPAQADFPTCDWLFTINLKTFPDQLRYTGSTLNPLVKGYISYAATDGSSNNNYETLWFCRGKAFGLERVAPLSITPGASVAIKVTFKSSSPGPYEFKSAVQSILRVYLDARLSNHAVQTVILPDDSYQDIIAAMADEHFTAASMPLETPVQLSSPIFLQDESDKHSLSMCYAPGSFGN